MKKIFFEAVPFDKGEVTLALESGVDAVIAEAEYMLRRLFSETMYAASTTSKRVWR